MPAITMPITMADENGDETTVALPAKWVICTHCNGQGKSSAYLGAFTQQDMDDAGPEFVEDYMRGEYDRPCDDCNGLGRVLIADEKRCTAPEHKTALQWIEDQRIAIAEERAIVRAEMRLLGDWS